MNTSTEFNLKANNDRVGIYSAMFADDESLVSVVWDEGLETEQELFTGTYEQALEFIRSSFNG